MLYVIRNNNVLKRYCNIHTYENLRNINSIVTLYKLSAYTTTVSLSYILNP